MPCLPVPLISALVLGFLLLRTWVAERRLGLLGALLALCALQGLVIALAQHYGAPGMRTVQPVTASLIPPAAWAAFQGTAVRRLRARDLLHLAGPALAVLAVLALPDALDALIPALFAGYGLALLGRARAGADTLPRVRIGAGDAPGRTWTIIAAALLGSATSDALIVAARAADLAVWQPWIVSLGASGVLLTVGGLSLSAAISAQPDEPQAPEPEGATPLDAEIMARLDALMLNERPYLDPDLSLTRLARRLRLPVKQLSGAINRVTGGNVSRYVNAARIGAAQDAMRAGQNVTSAMLSAGFNSKSNFNREFLRIAGESPSEWLRARRP